MLGELHLNFSAVLREYRARFPASELPYLERTLFVAARRAGTERAHPCHAVALSCAWHNYSRSCREAGRWTLCSEPRCGEYASRHVPQAILRPLGALSMT